MLNGGVTTLENFQLNSTPLLVELPQSRTGRSDHGYCKQIDECHRTLTVECSSHTMAGRQLHSGTKVASSRLMKRNEVATCQCYQLS